MGLPGMARPMTAFQGRLRHHRHQVEWPTLLRSEGQGRQANHRGAVMKPASIKPLRCAIYTRVSTEHGLDQEVNSLDAQYDAASAYIKSQAHAGSALIRSRYDDGWYSGVSTEPAGLAATAGRHPRSED